MTDNRLLGPNDPPPFEVLAGDATAPMLLICDHASRRVPAALADLGLSAEILETHIGWDIGAAEVTRQMSARFGATAVLAGYSRLVIDNNRDPGDPSWIPPESDHVPIPGNQDISDGEIAARVSEIFEPYHAAVGAELDRLTESGRAPVLFSVHSFTPVMDGMKRKWDVSVLWNEDDRLATHVADHLRAHDPHLIVGDNEPFSGKLLAATLNRHGAPRGLLHMVVEIRQDQLLSPDQIAIWSDRLARVLEPFAG